MGNSPQFQLHDQVHHEPESDRIGHIHHIQHRETKISSSCSEKLIFSALMPVAKPSQKRFQFVLPKGLGPIHGNKVDVKCVKYMRPIYLSYML
jgi:hypothetical protein